MQKNDECIEFNVLLGLLLSFFFCLLAYFCGEDFFMKNSNRLEISIILTVIFGFAIILMWIEYVNSKKQSQDYYLFLTENDFIDYEIGKNIQRDEARKYENIMISGSMIPSRYFSGFSNLKKVEIYAPEKEEIIINEYAFFGCTKLEEIHLSSTKINLKNDCFSGCHKLNKIYAKKLEDQSFESSFTDNSSGLNDKCEIIYNKDTCKNISALRKSKTSKNKQSTDLKEK